LNRGDAGERTTAGETEIISDRQEWLERAVAAYLEAADAGRAPDPGP
jgi:hypothetical protein